MNYLKELYASTGGGTHWKNNFAWNSDRDMCQWYGVGCDCDFNNTLNRMVCDVNVDLSNNHLKGFLPSVRTAFDSKSKNFVLKSLVLHNNFLSGSIPADSHLPRTSFDLSYNRISGTVPPLFSPFTSASIDLRHNRFEGRLISNPGQKLKLSNFQPYSEDQNRFTCPIPDDLMRNSNYEFLVCSLNDANVSLMQRIFRTLGANFSESFDVCQWNGVSCSRARIPYRLNLANRNLKGHIPTEIGMLDLSHLDLSANQLSGTIPSEVSSAFSERLHNAEFENKISDSLTLRLQQNQLSGTIPAQLGNINLFVHNFKKVELDLSENNLEGKVPDELKNIVKKNSDYIGKMKLVLNHAGDANSFECAVAGSAVSTEFDPGHFSITQNPCVPLPPSPPPPSTPPPTPPPPDALIDFVFGIMRIFSEERKCCRRLRCNTRLPEKYEVSPTCNSDDNLCQAKYFVKDWVFSREEGIQFKKSNVVFRDLFQLFDQKVYWSSSSREDSLQLLLNSCPSKFSRNARCANTCGQVGSSISTFINNGICEDGGFGSVKNFCELGTDCTDCCKSSTSSIFGFCEL